MRTSVYVHDRAVFEAATRLIESHGLNAAKEADTRAKASRNLGNVIHFCRWRQAQRLIVDMERDDHILH